MATSLKRLGAKIHRSPILIVLSVAATVVFQSAANAAAVTAGATNGIVVVNDFTGAISWCKPDRWLRHTIVPADASVVGPNPPAQWVIFERPAQAHLARLSHCSLQFGRVSYTTKARVRTSGWSYDGDKADFRALLLRECLVGNTERQQVDLDMQDFQGDRSLLGTIATAAPAKFDLVRHARGAIDPGNDPAWYSRRGSDRQMERRKSIHWHDLFHRAKL